MLQNNQTACLIYRRISQITSTRQLRSSTYSCQLTALWSTQFLSTAQYNVTSAELCKLHTAYFVVPAGTLRLPWFGVIRAFSSVVRQMPGYNSQRRGTDRTLPKLIVLFYVMFVSIVLFYVLFVSIVLFYVLFVSIVLFSVLFVCIIVYCTTATGCQPNCS
jgi:hypothetical protein